jgi:predicted GTPase
LTRIININKPSTRVHYELKEIDSPNLTEIIKDFIKEHNL